MNFWKFSTPLLLMIFSAQLPAFAKDLVDPQLVYAQNKFALKAFKNAHGENKEANQVFAPMGPGTLLRLFYPNTGREEQLEMASVLEVEGIEPEVVANRNAGLWMLTRNTDKEEVEYYSPMSFLGAEQTSLVEDFTRKASFFKIIPKSYDLKHPYMTYTINDWIKNNTQKQIVDVTKYFDPDSPLALFEAFYFKGKWGNAFTEEKQPLGFNNADGNPKPVKAISAEGNFGFYRVSKYEAVSLPYSTGRYGLFIFLPSKGSSLQEFIEETSQADFEACLGGLLDRPGKVTLPEFTVQSSWDLRALLKSLGLKKVFNEGADFHQSMTNAFGKTYFGSFEQQSVLVVNEEAVGKQIAVPHDIDASPRHEHFSMTVDRPFFFMIRDNKTQIWLALGTVTKLE